MATHAPSFSVEEEEAEQVHALGYPHQPIPVSGATPHDDHEQAYYQHQHQHHHSRSQTLDSTTSDHPAASLASPIKRKPLSSTASPLAVHYSEGFAPSPLDLAKPDARFSRSAHIDSPTLYEYPATTKANVLAPDQPERDPSELSDYDYYPFAEENDDEEAVEEVAEDSDEGREIHRVKEQRSSINPSDHSVVDSATSSVHSASRNIPDQPSAPGTKTTSSDVFSTYGDLIDESTPDNISSAQPPEIVLDKQVDHDIEYQQLQDDTREPVYSEHTDNSAHAVSMLATKPTPPRLKLDKIDIPSQEGEPPTATPIDSATPGSITPSNSVHQLNKPLPKSPAATSPLAGLFGWGKSNSTKNNLDSPSVTDFSSIPSPLSPARSNLTHDATHDNANHIPSTPGLQTNESSTNALSYFESYLSTPPSPIAVSPHQVAEMEDELKAISSELAGSIRREMDLEDLVDRLQEQINNPQVPNKRSSDYYSDSGYSSVKASDYDSSREEVEKIQRKSEQDKAQLRLELTSKLQDERDRRKALDHQIKTLSEKASHIDLAQMNNLDAKDRVKDLEDTCEDLRRKLSEERQSKGNFEDLLAALKGELQDACNERDNLRDEIVPQLRARVEGLESESAEYANLTYETTKMQQELEVLRQDNARLMGGDSLPSRTSLRMSGGLARANSVATSSMRNQRGPSSGLSRSNSVKNNSTESREVLAERLKDVEAQRDALHNALKNLLERQEFQNRENAKKIKVLEMERQRLLGGPSRKGGFERDISKLRTEINVLRRRAEDALDQKWQVEKGLGGLKMDLDRADEEIASLRSLLEEKDILIPPGLARSSGSSDSSAHPITSDSLRRAYEDLQKAYAESLERIKKLELDSSSDADRTKTEMALHRLEKSLSVAISERDAAVGQADSFRERYNRLSANEGKNLRTEKALADELADSAEHVEHLASQVRQQLARNADLRDRLAQTVARGDEDRKSNYERIAGLQVKLRTLEDQLVTTQSSSEERIGRHEEELTSLHEAHNDQLSRLTLGPQAARKTGLLANANGSAFPRGLRMQVTSSAATTIEEEMEVKSLRVKVAELEKALADAESEMQEVVAKMSTAQIEVLNLQEEREAAVRETKKLQKLLGEEQTKAAEPGFLSFGRS